MRHPKDRSKMWLSKSQLRLTQEAHNTNSRVARIHRARFMGHPWFRSCVSPPPHRHARYHIKPVRLLVAFRDRYRPFTLRGRKSYSRPFMAITHWRKPKSRIVSFPENFIRAEIRLLIGNQGRVGNDAGHFLLPWTVHCRPVQVAAPAGSREPIPPTSTQHCPEACTISSSNP